MRFRAEDAQSLTGFVAIHVEGEAEPHVMEIRKGILIYRGEGHAPSGSADLALSRETLNHIIVRSTSVSTSLDAGTIDVRSNRSLALKFAKLID